MLSLKPFNSDLADEISTNPDLYGPFWIMTTLIFVLACMGNLTAYEANDF